MLACRHPFTVEEPTPALFPAGEEDRGKGVGLHLNTQGQPRPTVLSEVQKGPPKGRDPQLGVRHVRDSCLTHTDDTQSPGLREGAQPLRHCPPGI